jgi:hypothetical protein
VVNGGVVRFALHGLVEFETLDDALAYIDRHVAGWTFATPATRRRYGDELLRRAVESRIVSMQTELPLEVLVTHTPAEIGAAVTALERARGATLHAGSEWRASMDDYRRALLAVRERWTTSLNCWSAAPTIAARVLSNWFLVDEGIALFGATYDSTEHFWQAVKYRPGVTVGEVRAVVEAMRSFEWPRWLASIEADQAFAFGQVYAIEFLRVNLGPERLAWFGDELAKAARDNEPARRAQQRVGRSGGDPVRFSALQEKVLWGDLADVLHLVVHMDGAAWASEPARRVPLGGLGQRLRALGFGEIEVAGYRDRPFPFLSRDFQDLMLEIWKVKFLSIPRLGDVLRSTSGRRLDHFLNDGDSPDIPIPIYVNQLNRIRELAAAAVR